MISKFFNDKTKVSQSNNRELNYLLIAPRISPLPFPKNLTDIPDHERPVIPHGLAYISSSMKTISKSVYNLNLEFESKEVFEAIQNSIEKYQIDVVLTTGLSGQFSKIKGVINYVKTINPDIIVVVGGGVITSSPEVAMNAFENVDIGVIGEGEYTICDLVEVLNNGGELASISGIIYKNEGEFITTIHRDEIRDLDALPFPDYLGLGYDKLWNAGRGVAIIAARSCPFNCTFCWHPSGSTSRMRSVDNIISEIKLLAENYPIGGVGIVGESFFTNRDRVIEFCEKIRQFKIDWSCTMHASSCKRDLLEVMRESGCISICIGIESACDSVLKSMNKKTSFKKIEEALNLIRDCKIGVTGNFIFGDIVEDMQTVEKTINWWRDNRKFPISLMWINIFPATAMYKYAVENGIIENEVEYLRELSPYKYFKTYNRRTKGVIAKIFN
ncbi:MAG: radical SAM protein [Ignavibacteria bacterium]